MTEHEMEIKALFYRDQFWFLSARLSSVQKNCSGHAFKNELKQVKKALAAGINDTQYHCDLEHFNKWDMLVNETKQLLKKVHALLTYRHYFAKVICYTDEENGGVLYRGEIIGMDDPIKFSGTTLEEAEQGFHDAIDDLLDNVTSYDSVDCRPDG